MTNKLVYKLIQIIGYKLVFQKLKTAIYTRKVYMHECMYGVFRLLAVQDNLTHVHSY